MSPFPFPADGLGAAADFARRLDELRRSGENRTRAALMSLVEVADAVERLANDPALAELPSNWRDGLSALTGKIAAALAEQGVTPIPTNGQTLDLRLHHVAETCDGPGEPDRIVRAIRAGWLWNERVLRPAEVVTVKAAPQDSSP